MLLDLSVEKEISPYVFLFFPITPVHFYKIYNNYMVIIKYANCKTITSFFFAFEDLIYKILKKNFKRI